MADVPWIYSGNLSPSITDQIFVNGKPYPLDGQTVHFQMRMKDGSDVVLDKPADVADAALGKVQYDWSTGDTDTPGRYVFWWQVAVAPGIFQDSEEHELDILDHAPGQDVRTGAIAARMRYMLPVTLDGLVNHRSFGEDGVQMFVDQAKFALFATVVPAAYEASVYSPPVLDYAARLATMRIIPPAIDYWNEQPTSISTSGTSESASYADRQSALWKIYDKLRRQQGSRRLCLGEDGVWTVALRGDSSHPVVSHKHGTDGTPFVTADPSNWSFPALPVSSTLYVGGSNLLPYAVVNPFGWPDGFGG
jgi:hypothetical protein